MAKLQSIVFFRRDYAADWGRLYAFISACVIWPLSTPRQHTRTLAFIPYTHQPAKARDGEAAKRGELLYN